MHSQHGTSYTIDVYHLPDGLDRIVHIASYEFPERRPQKRTLRFPILEAGITMFGQIFNPTCSMLRLTFDSAPSLFISLDAFEAAFAVKLDDPLFQMPIWVPWEEWGPKHTRALETLRQLVVFGRRAIYQNAILDFNPYDLANDIYGPTVSKGRLLRNTSDGYSGAIHTAGSTFPDEMSFPGPYFTTLPYRKMHLDIPIPRQDSLFSVFEEGGVQKVRSATRLVHVLETNSYSSWFGSYLWQPGPLNTCISPHYRLTASLHSL